MDGDSCKDEDISESEADLDICSFCLGVMFAGSDGAAKTTPDHTLTEARSQARSEESPADVVTKSPSGGGKRKRPRAVRGEQQKRRRAEVDQNRRSKEGRCPTAKQSNAIDVGSIFERNLQYIIDAKGRVRVVIDIALALIMARAQNRTIDAEARAAYIQRGRMLQRYCINKRGRGARTADIMQLENNVDTSSWADPPFDTWSAADADALSSLPVAYDARGVRWFLNFVRARKHHGFCPSEPCSQMLDVMLCSVAASRAAFRLYRRLSCTIISTPPIADPAADTVPTGKSARGKTLATATVTSTTKTTTTTTTTTTATASALADALCVPPQGEMHIPYSIVSIIASDKSKTTRSAIKGRGVRAEAAHITITVSRDSLSDCCTWTINAGLQHVHSLFPTPMKLSSRETHALLAATASRLRAEDTSAFLVVDGVLGPSIDEAHFGRVLSVAMGLPPDRRPLTWPGICAPTAGR